MPRQEVNPVAKKTIIFKYAPPEDIHRGKKTNFRKYAPSECKSSDKKINFIATLQPPSLLQHKCCDTSEKFQFEKKK